MFIIGSLKLLLLILSSPSFISLFLLFDFSPDNGAHSSCLFASLLFHWIADIVILYYCMSGMCCFLSKNIDIYLADS